MPYKRWTREQTLAVLYLKLKHPGRLTVKHSAVQMLAKVIDHNENSIRALKGNFDSLDTSIHGTGLRNAAQLTVDIWGEYERDPERVFAEARRAYLKLERQAGT